MILLVSVCLVFCYFLNFLYKGLNKTVSDPGKHRDQTKGCLQGYIPASPASSSLNSGQHTAFNRHDLTAQGWVTPSVCASLYTCTFLYCCIVVVVYFVFLFCSICFAMVILSYSKLIFPYMCRNAERNVLFYNSNVNWRQIKWVFRVRTNLIGSFVDSPEMKPLCVCVNYLFILAYLFKIMNFFLALNPLTEM